WYQDRKGLKYPFRGKKAREAFFCRSRKHWLRRRRYRLQNAAHHFALTLRLLFAYNPCRPWERLPNPDAFGIGIPTGAVEFRTFPKEPLAMAMTTMSRTR